jgi:DNA-directed RNA polymerase subunit M/transcription elongation factor TFIIS
MNATVCDHCKHRFEVPSHYINREVKCPECAKHFKACHAPSINTESTEGNVKNDPPEQTVQKPGNRFANSGVFMASFLILIISLILGLFVAAPFFILSGIAFITCVITNDTREFEAAQQRIRDQQAQIVCPHCQTRGQVTAYQVKLKKGISGGKATAALLTGGLTMLGTGLSRKEIATEARCSNCGSVWHY